MTALPHRVVLHQQLEWQVQTQLNGLRMRSRRLRPIGTDDTGRGLSAQPRLGSAVSKLVPDHVNDLVGGGVDSLLGVNVRADLGDRVLNGEDGRALVIDLDVVLFDVDVHDFRQAFDALLLAADGEGFKSVVSMLISVSATVPPAVEPPPHEVSATT